MYHCWKRHFVAIDTETSGLLPHGRLLEVAAVRCDMQGTVLGRFEAIICPDDPNWAKGEGAAEALAANNLEPEFVAGGVSVLNPDFWDSFISFLTLASGGEGRLPLVVAHRSAFDVGILLNEFTHARNHFLHMKWCKSLDLPLCTLGCDLLLRPDGKSRSLKATAQRWGVTLQEPAHRAMGDALTAAAIFSKMLPELPDLDDVVEYSDPLQHLVGMVDTQVEGWAASKQKQAQALADGRDP